MDEPRPFNQFLLEQRNGGLHRELSEELQALVAACVEQGRGGQLTLTIKVDPLRQGLNQYQVSDNIRTKAPEADRGASLFFADGSGNLSRSDPRQPELPLREAPPAPTAIREVQS